jgi:tetratricopeptide (TPR) repeat protein
MASADDGVPTRPEVEKQLQRMLQSKRLQGAPNQAMLVEFVVRQRFENTKISENIIGRKLFPKYAKDTSDDVRVTATNLRKTLAKYYAEEGAADSVVITLPRGPRYRPMFSFNSPAAKPYARGLHQHAAMAHVNDGIKAIEQFDKAIALDPGYAPAYAAKAEIQLSRAPYAAWPGSKELVSAAEASAREALRLSPSLWRPHIVLGMVHASRCAWDKAEASFKAALRASPEDTARHFWYAAYLLATGRKQKALRLAGESARDAPGNPVAQTVRALFLYVARDFEKAEALLNEVKIANHWLTHIVLACVLQRKSASEDSWTYVTRAHETLHAYAFPGLETLCLHSGGPDTQQKREQHARNLFSRMKANSPQKSLQLALCHIAFGDPRNAVAALRRARDEHDPLMVWAHLWPLFDPLRKHPGFRQLIRQMRFPSAR